MDLRKLIGDAVGKAFKGGWLERKLNGGVEDALSNSIENVVNDVVRSNPSGGQSKSPVTPVDAVLERLQSTGQERSAFEMGWFGKLLAKMAGPNPEDQAERTEPQSRTQEQSRERSPFEMGWYGKLLAKLAGPPPTVDNTPPPTPPRTETQQQSPQLPVVTPTRPDQSPDPAGQQSKGWWDRLIAKLAGPAPSRTADAADDQSGAQGLRERAPEQRETPPVSTVQTEKQDANAEQSATANNIDAIVADVSSVTNDIHQTSQSIEDILNGLNATFRVNAGNRVVTQERQTQPEPAASERRTEQRRERPARRRSIMERVFGDYRQRRTGQRRVIGFGRNAGRRVAGFFGRSGSAGARMGGRVAAGFARFAGPAAMGVAGAAGSMAPVVIGAAVAGKVLGIVGAVGAVVAAALNKLADSAINATVRISQYDARLAGSRAMLDVGRTLRDIQMARATGRSGSELLRAQDRYERAYQPLGEELQNIKNNIAKSWIEFKTTIVNNVALPILNGMVEGFEMVEGAFDGVMSAMEALPLVGNDIKAIREMNAEAAAAHKRAERGKEFMENQRAAQQQIGNLNHMLDAAGRRAPF